jgi:uncharacterized protein (TIGR03435 family)
MSIGVFRAEPGLEGSNDVSLEWTPDPSPFESANSSAGLPVPPPSGGLGPSIFTAVQEQLGLKLEPRQGPVDVHMIDRVTRPSDDQRTSRATDQERS